MLNYSVAELRIKSLIMNIEYRETKDFTEKEIEELFLSVNWLSGKYPSRLIKALKSSSLVITAWNGSK